MNFNKEKLKKGTSGRNIHRFLIKEVFRIFSNLGYSIQIEYNFVKGKRYQADVYATKGDQRIVIECLTRPTLRIVTEKQKYKKHCDKLFVAYPSRFVPTFPIDMFFDKVFEIDIPENIIIENTKQSMAVTKETARRVQMVKQSLGYSTADETINNIFDIAETIQPAK